MELSRIQEDYLHIIYEIVQEKNYARIKDISLRLQVKAPTVNNMVKRLKNMDLVIFEKNSPICLTPKGQSIAKIVKNKHETFKRFFEILNLPKNIAEKDALKIEHNLNPETISKMKSFIDFLDENEETHNFKKQFEKYCKVYK